jgi:hypothetical protein
LRAQNDFRSLKANFHLQLAIFTRSKQISSVQADFYALKAVFTRAAQFSTATDH